ncbi:Methyltransferase domain-containing protein [Glycomyces sambucus]|uniref:Methyltransferase domain-containing protein n=1 Tax=Glycomyces sambucus TaxID=380244 RepID=A0A1G9MXS4_9ACTN|nr:class I SAM-dependent methyltransferase [Glycomyces sambucus]SDL79038.1 Methyltransferase domain-containing protein [Glycomyces sambucus]
MPHDHAHDHGTDHHRHHGPIEGRHSHRYNRIARLLGPLQYRRIAADIAASAPRNAAVLDIGTGPGILLRVLAKRRPDLRLTGVDLAQDMIDHATRNLAHLTPAPDLRAADVAALPFDDGAFDLVVSTYSSHHWSDPAAGATEIARVLRPDGRFLDYDFPRAPFEALTALTESSRTPFRSPWLLLMKTTRFEAAKR